ncbi:hypothetical protein C4M96_02115 [Mycoplasmopsis pullorum]|uniref:hypothetical protein n=1 Tax=Mycoplasmopsis pullorum TaxID=48003 RepID=UPI00111950D1|nr:hypothetical protein [Mycoplasmopsis pullorum]TNK83522.1 hypothetical protein C4M93_02240 [Mycoplasmopsis pullorum]TNK92089.1 hypothetical protein C4M96_02115 [Mycoplasmopsis pullorum]
MNTQQAFDALFTFNEFARENKIKYSIKGNLLNEVLNNHQFEKIFPLKVSMMFHDFLKIYNQKSSFFSFERTQVTDSFLPYFFFNHAKIYIELLVPCSEAKWTKKSIKKYNKIIEKMKQLCNSKNKKTPSIGELVDLIYDHKPQFWISLNDSEPFLEKYDHINFKKIEYVQINDLTLPYFTDLVK